MPSSPLYFRYASLGAEGAEREWWIPYLETGQDGWQDSCQKGASLVQAGSQHILDPQQPSKPYSPLLLLH